MQTANAAKPWYASKTVWTNVITVLVAILMFVGIQPVIPTTWGPYILLLVGVLNIILRFVTNQAITA